MHPGKPVSIRDVAKRAGVSVTTVSHALSGKRPVAKETVERIRALVPELGYVPYFAARTLQSGRSFMIGVVVPDLSNPFFGAVATGVEDLAHSREYGVTLFTSRSDPRREKRFFNMLRSGTIDGLVYNAGDAPWDDMLATIATQFPVVAVDEEITGIDCPVVTSDHREGGRLAAEHLRELGHRQVAVVTGPPGLTSSTLRAAGFTEIFHDAVVREGDYTEAAGAAFGRELAVERPEVTGVFAANDLMAFGVIAELDRAGRSVPSDVSVVGFDDLDFAHRITPPLTTVRQSPIDLGREAAALLLDRVIDQPDAGASRRRLAVELVVRSSTGAARPR
ncbi:LacI family DNA-binding transcriptional regulator [Pseudonocardia ailaonensis]|uniref:LacI family DNA-binding transcriptional regulator n=2 Tax=Pseudonocardia ailaonensis TaxID=367279 RepID=A0ABN2MH15_9PSEU